MMRLGFLSLAAAATVLLTQPSFAAQYTIDTAGQHAAINFRVKHLGFSWLSTPRRHSRVLR